MSHSKKTTFLFCNSPLASICNKFSIIFHWIVASYLAFSSIGLKASPL